MSESIRVLIVDDHPAFREGLAELLRRSQEFFVDIAGSGKEAARMAATLRPDVALVDVCMPGDDGISAAREIGKASPGTAVAMLTAFDADAYRKAAIAIPSVRGYLLKNTPLPELRAAIRTIYAGSKVLGAVRPGRTKGPRRSEMAVLRLAAAGLSNREIAARLVLSERTVHTHLSRIFAELGASSRTQAIAFALRDGIISSQEIVGGLPA